MVMVVVVVGMVTMVSSRASLITPLTLPLITLLMTPLASLMTPRLRGAPSPRPLLLLLLQS
jgi:hypothetical protein